ncbi:MAG: ribonuclease P protein component [bacterium]
MLSRKYRAIRSDIEETIKTGISISGKFLFAKISKKEKQNLGFAIIISKKNEKTSVGRHIIKRKISSFIEKNLPKINSNFKKTIIFFLKKTNEPLICKKNFKEIEKDIEFILNQI